MSTESKPNYKAIFSDIIDKKFPEKRDHCTRILKKNQLDSLDIITLNNLLFGNSNKEAECFNQKHRSYKASDIEYILEYQKKNNLSNIQLALHFKLSRNSISKWKKTINQGSYGVNKFNRDN